MELSGIGGHAVEDFYSFLTCVWKRSILLPCPHKTDHLLVQPRSSGETSGPMTQICGPVNMQGGQSSFQTGQKQHLIPPHSALPKPQQIPDHPRSRLKDKGKGHTSKRLSLEKLWPQLPELWPSI